MRTHIFGIRHHGPGSARSLLRALEQLRPDAILVEGPPDAQEVLPLLAHPAMRPPVALLVYMPDEPQHAAYFPLAAFSPEWQAIRFGLAHGIPVRFMDLPQAHQLNAKGQTRNAKPEEPEAPDANFGPAAAADQHPNIAEAPDLQPSAFSLQPAEDPLGFLAAAAGYSDGERWWEHMVEQRRDGADMFAAILEAMRALREEFPQERGPLEAQREAWMRQTIRTALSEGYERVAVVCGAWHSPALLDLAGAREDAALLKGLPRVKTAATWVPWTYARLSFASGYGAGVESPGWYDHLWRHPEDTVVRWMARVAHLLRDEGLDVSSAHVIEAVRLAEALAALRDRPLPGLPELNEACLAVLCHGADTPMQLITGRLIVGERLGAVPDETPMVPLQQDLRRTQKRLRLPPEAAWKDYDLDLRRPIDLERSQLLRRLALLGVPWGQLRGSAGTGTFREIWRLQWEPELDVALIEAGVWGTTISDAAGARALDTATRAADLPALVTVVNQVLLAGLPDVVGPLMAQLAGRAALTGDVGQLMDALVREDDVTRASLVGSLRYGGVRQTDVQAITRVVDGLAARICIGLPGACASLDDDAAQVMFDRIVGVDGALRLLQNGEHLAAWHAALRRVADMAGAHGLVAGRCCRILLDAGALGADEAGRRLSLALSPAAPPLQAGAWVEGLLRSSAALLLYDETLWPILDRWVAGLSADAFQQALPLLRRTFATFTAPERRMMGERARQADRRPTSGDRRDGGAFDPERATAVLPLVARLLGVNVSLTGPDAAGEPMR
ncbi:MAG TPA: DUF5682 family protein [Roseiflexaceae bacterium]|nr:DUF5682 family protein [Roseiflexaceae bacterium]